MVLSFLRGNEFRLQVIAFTTGFALMTFELVAARLLAPAIGSSMYVWTSVIGVIIAALSAGYWLGGWVADRRHLHSDVAWLLIATALAVLLTMLTYSGFLETVVVSFTDGRIQGVVASLVLFAPVSFLLGVLSPYLVKLNVVSLDTSGRSVASLSALNSIGGIAGTFVTGFILFGLIGSQSILLIVLVLLVVSSWLVTPKETPVLRVLASSFLVLVGALSIATPSPSEGVVDINTPSAHYRVFDYWHDGRYARGLSTGPTGIQSAVYMDNSTDLVFWYTREIARLVDAIEPSSVLILGGGAFTLPQHIAIGHPGALVDVVEIDPGLERIATEYFGYSYPENVRLHFADARAYLAKATQKYDAIVVDVYGDTSIPFQLLSSQYGEVAASRLNEDGVVIANVIGAREGPCSGIIAAVSGSYSAVLPYAQYSTEAPDSSWRANYIIAYSGEELALADMTSLPMSGQRTFNDDFVPSERMYQQCISGS